MGHGRLYDLEIAYGDDRINSYFGLREVAFDGYKFRINGKSVYQRLVLDQGFYPAGIYTAPDDQDLIHDIEISMEMGFNGARLHQKVFEERYLYHCDRLGYMVWGEFPDWGLNCSDPMSLYSMLPQWTEEVRRDANHPCIVMWCPHNETQRGQYDPAIETVWRATKELDPTRPCIDASGWFHVKTDVYDLHDYEQNPQILRSKYEKILRGNELWEHEHAKGVQRYAGEPIIMSEYGGIGWTDDQTGWGYGNGPKTKEEFMERLKGLTDALLENERFCGFCYTQLTDVEQEQNGLYTYSRKPKFNVDEIYKIITKKAKIED